MARIKKGQTWGGDWTEEKLNAFSKYVNAYLTIMNKYRDKYNWKLIYFDGFAGSGTDQHAPEIDDKANDNLFLQELESSELYVPSDSEVYKGAAERVLSVQQRGFDIYYFIDKNEYSKLSLEERLSRYKSTHTLAFRCGDANDMLQKMSEFMHTTQGHKHKALVLLDPFGMQVSWNSIENFKDTGTDFWILVPTGVIVNRLLDKKGELRYIDKLKDFFGLNEPEIRSHFYQRRHEMTLFGETDVIEKVKEPIGKIAQLYLERLKTVFTHVIPEPLVLYNNTNVPIYHFVFASNNETAVKIAKEIIGKK
ncbi:MAG: three-Cys-motif partner protein TcmP [Bacteroides sp.]|nr:three-Cys-motif partner protein TcmP [Bacteroides sp.]